MMNITITMNKTVSGTYVAAPNWTKVAKRTRRRQHPLAWFWTILGLRK